jgi:multiple sugar transport system substrate-binding protein
MQGLFKFHQLIFTFLLLIVGMVTAQVELRYALWDSQQQPAYESCAAEFTQQNPNIAIRFEQAGWGEYWSGLQTDMVVGGAPDVFTNYYVYAPEFARRGQIVDIQPLVERDGVDVTQYIAESADLWTLDGGRYGLPKDWDGIAVAYNIDMFEAAGISPDVMNEWTFDPEDGGTFDEIVARLTLDANGNDGLSPDFDRNNVVQYGFLPHAFAPHGNQSWSNFALSNGFTFQEEGSSEFNFDDPVLASTLTYLADLQDRGFAPPSTDIMGLGALPLFQAGEGALVVVGSWSINQVADSDVNAAFGPVPVGSEGRRVLSNSLGDSIWTGSRHQEEAWEWVKFLASPACQEIVGSYGAVLPAIPSGTEAALAAFSERGIDVSAFIDVALGQADSLAYFPYTDNTSELNAIIQPVLDNIFLGRAEPGPALTEVNERINALFR